MKKIALIFLFAVIPVSLLLSPFLIKANINCLSQYGDCPDDIKSDLAKFNGKSLFSIVRGVKKNLGSNFLVSDYSLQFKLPNILKVDLIVKKPSFAIKDASTRNFFLISQDGHVLSVAESSALPALEMAALLKVGTKVDSKTIFALQLVGGVFEMYQVSVGRIEGDSLHVDLPHQIRVIFPIEGDKSLLLGSLRLIYAKITTEGLTGKFSEIDLRYKNPVLR